MVSPLHLLYSATHYQEVKSNIKFQCKVGQGTHIFPHQLSTMPPLFGSVNVKNITIIEIAVPASRAYARI